MENQELNKDDSKNQKKIDILYLTVITLSILFTVGLFILFFIDDRSCDGMMGGLSGDCTTFNYGLIGFFSIPLIIFAINSFKLKQIKSLSICTIIFFLANLLIVIVAASEKMKFLSLISCIFSIILLIIEKIITVIEKK